MSGIANMGIVPSMTRELSLWLAAILARVWLALIPNLLAAFFANALIPLLHGDRDEVAIDPDAVPRPTMVMTRIYDTCSQTEQSFGTKRRH